MGFLIALGIGAIIGLVMSFVSIFGYRLIKNTLDRRFIKRQIKEGKILKPLDEKDFDYEKWKDVIKIDPSEKEKLNQIFNK